VDNAENALSTGPQGPTTATAKPSLRDEKCVNHVSEPRCFTLSPVQISPLRGGSGRGVGVNRGNVADWHAEVVIATRSDQFPTDDGTANDGVKEVPHP